MIEQELMTILKESYDINVEQIDQTTNLREHLDSIDFLGFLLDVKKKYHIDIEPSEIKNYQTIEQVAEAIRKNKA